MAYLTPDDLQPFAVIDTAKCSEMIADATAKAILVAPCLATEDDLDEWQTAAVKAVLRAAVLRWNEAGTGVRVSETTGPFSESFEQPQRKSLLWPSEIEDLQKVCLAVTGESNGGAFSIDTAPPLGGVHADWCSLNFGATYCSCGVDIAGYPIFGS